MSHLLNPSITGLRRLLVWTVVVTFALITLGAWVRVADAGLSCPDWPMCYGKWLPFPAPEGGYVAEGVTYTLGQVLLEWGHRFLAALVGFLYLAVLYISWKLRKENRRFLPLAIAGFIVLFLQIKLGGLTVILDNVNWSVAVHLGNAIIFYTLLLLLLMAAIRPAESLGTPTRGLTKIVVWAAPIMIYITMLLGAMVSTSHAGGVCGGLFDCVGSWWPENDPMQALHMLHRYAALLTTLTVLAVFAATRREVQPLAKTGRILVVFTLIQALIGIVVLYSFSHYAWAYQGLSVFHLAWGTVLYTVGLTGVVKIYWGVKDPDAKTLPGHP